VYAVIPEFTQDVLNRIAGGSGLFLCLDYDGTLAEFAPTPDDIIPNPEVIDLVSRLTNQTNVQVVIISGRRLKHIQTLLPVQGIFLAGTYGLEMQNPTEGEFHQIELGSIRPILEAIKTRWSKLLDGRKGFYLEDKGWTLAIHARFADEIEATKVLSNAQEVLKDAGLTEEFRILGGSKFLEVGPSLANKGKTVAYLLKRYRRPGELIVYVGDDDKDEEAFAEVKAWGGIPVVVSAIPRPSLAEYRLTSPEEVRAWLMELVSHLDEMNN
jgi:trehalose 6-phosphate phosphatase